MQEWGLFNDESADWTEAEAVEAGFWSEEEAKEALTSRYSPDDFLTIHKIEEADEESEEE